MVLLKHKYMEEVKALTKYERHTEIMNMLSTHNQFTMLELATKFKVSVRTISRDILDLTLSYPIHINRGSNGGVRLDKNYKYNKRYLNNEQYTFLKKLGTSLNEKDKEVLKSVIIDFSIEKDTSWII